MCTDSYNLSTQDSLSLQKVCTSYALCTANGMLAKSSTEQCTLINEQLSSHTLMARLGLAPPLSRASTTSVCPPKLDTYNGLISFWKMN